MGGANDFLSILTFFVERLFSVTSDNLFKLLGDAHWRHIEPAEWIHH